MDRSKTRTVESIDTSKVADKTVKDALDKVLKATGKTVAIQNEKGANVPMRWNSVTNTFELYVNGKWTSNGAQAPSLSRPVTMTSWPNAYVAPGSGSKINYDERGLVVSGEVAEMTDINGLPSALSGKADTSHTHAQGDVTGLVSDLSGKAPTSHSHAISDVTALQTALDAKALTSTDGQRLKVYDTGTASWVYITCANGVLSVVSS